MYVGAVIWDVDGTLADTIDLCVTGLRNAIIAHGGPALTPDEVQARFGPTEEGVLRNEVGDRWEDAIEMYLDEYRLGHDGVGFPFVSDVVRRRAPDP